MRSSLPSQSHPPLARDRWAAISELFDRAAGLPRGPERDEYLHAAARGDAELLAEVERMLAAHERDGALERLSDRLAADITAALPQEPSADTHVGPYRILETLGSGGQGIVYLAQRDGEGFQQRVAVKVLRVGVPGQRDALLRRFLAERGILARLEHPTIPRFLDGGITARGEPWFAMEHVRGIPVDRYCDERNLSVRQRLSLLASVCDAVHYAHRHLVVHRDLKPSNILVTDDGLVKVLDFGIAKLLDPTNGSGGAEGITASERWLTPNYASPEQVRGEAVTTAADVFALGVVLYELIACQRPHIGRTKHDVERAILETDPVRPSEACLGVADKCASRGMSVFKLQRELQGDLDTITLKALSKASERRYTTAGDLGDDLRRFLAGLPVHARADSAAYRARKFVTRHKRLVAALAVAALSIVGGGIGISVAARQAMRNARVANAERARAEEVSRFAVELFRSAGPLGLTARSPDVTARELLDRGAQRIRRELADQPVRRAAMLEVLAQSYAGLGIHDSVRAMAHEALALRRAANAAPEEVATSLALLGEYFHVVANSDSAKYYLRLATEHWPTSGGREERAELLLKLTSVYNFTERSLAEVESLQVAAVRELQGMMPRGHPSIASALSSLAATRYNLGKVREASEDFGRVLAMRMATLGDHPDVASAMHSVGVMREANGDLDSAAVLYTRAAALKRRLLGATHSSYARSLSALAQLQMKRGNAAAAESLATESLAIRRAALGDTHLDVAWDMSLLGAAKRARGKTREAEQLQRGAMVIVGTLEPAHAHRTKVQIDYAGTLIALGRGAEAEAVLVTTRTALQGLDSRNAGLRRRETDSLLALLRRDDPIARTLRPR